jgi:16S rRNA (adenine1518-N6/adenine1519-N6)-dimethyltransferase
MNLSDRFKRGPIFDLRPEQLDVAQFIELTKNRSGWNLKSAKT